MNYTDKLFIAQGGRIKEASLGDIGQLAFELSPLGSAVDMGRNAWEGGGRLLKGDFGGAARSGLKFLGNAAMTGVNFIPGGSVLSGLARGVGRMGIKMAPKMFGAIGRQVPTLINRGKQVGNLMNKPLAAAQNKFVGTGVGKAIAANPIKTQVGSAGASMMGHNLEENALAGQQRSINTGNQLGEMYNNMRANGGGNFNPIHQSPSPAPTYMQNFMA